ncbi:Putative Flp pilus-assembly TadE/G-like [Micromonospora pattaloongensis]|uniref:Flp pilus-assembly TadE/G-like n=1 Tax=Micromonospora pattaloongensis TaxID=405436 RepID=A0A1H3NRR8_9ACTN|nr:Tad domain-containing protein [Micromonospora pattaloongensis]SDY90869.1 Putative Flp pilus-assembly TadE/G-like [Micromonospora pattaloongensis]
MPRLSRIRRPSDADRGAVTTTVAIVLGCGVLLGMAAIVVDVGRLYAEREQLQSGADAAVWAMAEECVRTPADCTDRSPTAARYANANAADGAATVAVVCGRGGALPGCPPPATNHTACLGAAPATGPYVEIRTATRLPDGSTLLPATFAAAVTPGDDDGTEVGACARAAWGSPRSVDGLAVTISTCEWRELTDHGTTFWPAPELGNPPTSAERVLYLKDGKSRTCPAGPSGWDAPGGFGWLDAPAGTCHTIVAVDGAYDGDTGNSVPGPCKTALTDARADRRVLFLPVYDGVTGQGANTRYHLAGFAAFVLTGYEMSGFSAPSSLTGKRPCSGAERCLSGYFTRALVPTAVGQIGGPEMGVSIVKLVG